MMLVFPLRLFFALSTSKSNYRAASLTNIRWQSESKQQDDTNNIEKQAD